MTTQSALVAAPTYRPAWRAARPVADRLERLEFELEENLTRHGRRIPELESTLSRERSRARLWLGAAGLTLAVGALGGPVGLAAGALACALPLALGVRSLARASGARTCLRALQQASETCRSLQGDVGELRQQHQRRSVERLVEPAPGSIREEPESVTIGAVRLKRR